MGSKHLGADMNLAWPTAQIAVMGAQGAVNILYRKEIAEVLASGGDVDAARQRFITEYEDTLANPYAAAGDPDQSDRHSPGSWTNPRSQWSSPARMVRTTHPHGPCGWRASASPRADRSQRLSGRVPAAGWGTFHR